jgi:predicted negative regulator of RcsB-dependent stress response
MYTTSYFERRYLIMKRRLIVVAVVLFALVVFVGFNLLTPGAVRAQTTDECVHAPTIDSLENCVEHAAQHGIIDNQGVTNSLLAKLDAAQAALDRGQTSVAINNLEAFIHEVQAQAGKHIDQVHAGHLVEHAQVVIQALKNG